MKFISVNIGPILYLTPLTFMVQCIEFDRNLFGIIFQPYVMHKENGIVVPGSYYACKNLKTMLEVVSTKFTRILTSGPAMHEPNYVKNRTYYNTGDIITRTAEAAAVINADRNNKSLEVVIATELTSWRTKSQMQSELQAVVEAAQISNSICPGTVIGIQLNCYITYGVTTIDSISFWITKLRDMTTGLGTRIGLSVFPEDLTLLTSPRGNNTVINNIWNLTKQIILNCDFIVYMFGPDIKRTNVGDKFARLSSKVTDFRNRVQKINKNVKVIWYTYLSGFNFNNFEEIKMNWAALNQYAIEEKISVWTKRNFVIPTFPNTSRDWWELKRNDFIDVSDCIVDSSGKPTYAWQKLTHNPLRQYVTTSKTLVNSVSMSTVISSFKRDNFTEAKNTNGLKISNPGKSQSATSAYLSSTIYVTLIVCAVFGGVALTYIIFARCHKSTSATVMTAQDIKEFKFGLKVDKNDDLGEHVRALHLPYDLSLETPKTRFELLWDERLGMGEFGLVYKANLTNKNGKDTEVAVKLPKQDSILIGVKGILSEIKVLTYLGYHPNIVSICGAYTTEAHKGVVYLALELCPLGSLKKYLKKLKLEDTSIEELSMPFQTSTEQQRNFAATNILRELTRWSNEIACGMEHLEKKNVIHADLATRNVLLTADKTAKITDFGLSRRLYEYSNYNKRSQTPLPWRWLPLESLRNHEFSLKSDVWSYGVTLWEIFSFGDLPFPERSWNNEFMKDLGNGLRLEQPTIAPDHMLYGAHISNEVLCLGNTKESAGHQLGAMILRSALYSQCTDEHHYAAYILFVNETWMLREPKPAFESI